MNQQGEIQPIGGVNEKIEGFFDVCNIRGLTGDQGVIIPATNVKHLMLREDVREAVEAGKFAIHAIDSVDDGIELLTGIPAGQRDDQGLFPDGSLNRRVEDTLARYSETMQAYASKGGKGSPRKASILMTPATEQAAIRRILVTLNASESGRPALETAVRLAAILGAELEGVFVEDINLIRLTGLPFLREVRPWSLAEETISTQRMQRELRTLARHAESMLEQAAREMGVSWSFQVWRGRAEAASLAQAFTADVLSLGRVSSLVSSRMRGTIRPLARQSRETVDSISVLFSASEQAVRAAATACSLAKDLGGRLTVLLPEDQAGDRQALKEKARTILNLHEQPARFVQLTGTDVQSLLQAADASGIGILIAEAEHPLLQQAGLDQCLEALSCPVLLVR